MEESKQSPGAAGRASVEEPLALADVEPTCLVVSYPHSPLGNGMCMFVRGGLRVPICV